MAGYQPAGALIMTAVVGLGSAGSARVTSTLGHPGLDRVLCETVSRRDAGIQFIGGPCALGHAEASNPERVVAWPRVRSSDSYVTAIIAEAMTRSATFRRLVHAVELSDGIVYVERGDCRHGVRACLVLTATPAAQFLILRVLVDPRQQDWDVMAFIGHELQHAIEVLRQPTLRNAEQIYAFYSREYATGGDTFETTAAVRAGDDVKNEVESFARNRVKSR